ncbi:MAG TPA: hypothetical protein VMT54_00595 [Candidatus Cybelea sp.]|nr:hypothetical protein [Candidatus Cybelea sp.]
MTERSNVERLVEAGVLDAKTLRRDGHDAINGIHLSDEEIEVLKRIKLKLKLEPLILEGPEGPVSRSIHAWHL